MILPQTGVDSPMVLKSYRFCVFAKYSSSPQCRTQPRSFVVFPKLISHTPPINNTYCKKMMRKKKDFEFDPSFYCWFSSYNAETIALRLPCSLFSFLLFSSFSDMTERAKDFKYATISLESLRSSRVAMILPRVASSPRCPFHISTHWRA